MKRKTLPRIMATMFLIGMFCTTLSVRIVGGWSNGGYSADPSNPDYGTHDWIAQHALDWLPTHEKQYILDNLAAYLYGTELPDNGGAPDGIGDTTKHHIYYNSAEVMADDAAAVRVSTEYNNTLSFLKAKDYAKTAKNAGILSHYIADMAVFGHVMGSDTDWGNEIHHTQDYEPYVNVRTSSYSAEFNSYLAFDGELTTISAYDAAKNLAYDTTFDVNGDLTCVWMDQNYDWNNPTFRNRAGESLNLAVNYLADVLHTLALESEQPNIRRVPQDYTLIQWAINAADQGDTVCVSSGTYNERLVVNKTVNLIGENRDTTIIDAKGTGTAVSITAANVNITGFTIRNGEWGIEGGFIVSDNIVENNDNGISNSKLITKNIVRKNGRLIASNTGYGISSGDATVEQNRIYNNFYGIAAYHSAIRNNEIFSNGIGSSGHYYDGAGILDVVFVTGGYNNILFNTIKENYVGISLSLWGGGQNVVYKNNFVSNQKQISGWQPSGNIYDNGAEGNYWSDYNGIDGNGDGIGDTLLPHLGLDKFPLVQLWSEIRTFNAYDWKGVTYQVAIQSNSTIASFNFNHTLKQASFNAIGPTGKVGFSNVTIPKFLLNGNPWQVLMDENEIPVALTENASDTFLYFAYDLTTHKIKILGTEALDTISPIANAGADQTINEDTLVIFDGSASSDNVGIASYAWTFIDGTSKTLTGQKPSYLFGKPGEYDVTLNTSDAVGNWATDNVKITVLDVTAPTAIAGEDQTVQVGMTLRFDAGSSADNVGIVTYEWDFGDGTTGTGKTTTHTYATAGTYTVMLTIKDAAGNKATDSITLTVFSPEAFPMWIIGAAVAATTIAAATILFLKKRKQPTKKIQQTLSSA